MACNTQPGPAMAIHLIETHLTGVKLTQKDWHMLRESASAAKGAPLSQAIATEEEKFAAAMALTRALRMPNDEAATFTAEFLKERNTVGTCETLVSVARNGIPSEIISRKRRNRGRPAQAKKSTTAADDSKQCVVSQDMTPSGVVVDGVNQRIPLYRVTKKGKLVGVSLSKEAAHRIAEKFDANPRW